MTGTQCVETHLLPPVALCGSSDAVELQRPCGMVRVQPRSRILDPGTCSNPSDVFGLWEPKQHASDD